MTFEIKSLRSAVETIIWEREQRWRAITQLRFRLLASMTDRVTTTTDAETATVASNAVIATYQRVA